MQANKAELRSEIILVSRLVEEPSDGRDCKNARLHKRSPLIKIRWTLAHPAESWPELQIGITQLVREGSPPPSLRLLQAELSRNSNQIARGRIRRFESYMPSHAVVSNFMNLKTAHRPCSRTAGVRQHSRTTCCGRYATAVK